MQVERLFAAVLAGDVFRDVVHRTRAIERHEGDQVFHAVGLHLAQQVAHAAYFELEDAGGRSPC
jgi:predicted nucleotide-binding protein (sugar kinase/HSP70/actin superfamily)